MDKEGRTFNQSQPARRRAESLKKKKEERRYPPAFLMKTMHPTFPPDSVKRFFIEALDDLRKIPDYIKKFNREDVEKFKEIRRWQLSEDFFAEPRLSALQRIDSLAIMAVQLSAMVPPSDPPTQYEIIFWAKFDAFREYVATKGIQGADIAVMRELILDMALFSCPLILERMNIATEAKVQLREKFAWPMDFIDSIMRKFDELGRQQREMSSQMGEMSNQQRELKKLINRRNHDETGAYCTVTAACRAYAQLFLGYTAGTSIGDDVECGRRNVGGLRTMIKLSAAPVATVGRSRYYPVGDILDAMDAKGVFEEKRNAVDTVTRDEVFRRIAKNNDLKKQGFIDKHKNH